MRIPSFCPSCLIREHKQRLVRCEIEGEMLAGRCSLGHEVRYWALPRHELLLNVGAKAIADDYYREAVSNFATALEESFAFYVEVSCIGPGRSRDAVRDALKANRLAERRNGMVSVCYFLDTGRPFPHLPGRRVEFRNKVVHNAEWPDRSEVLDYAEFVCRAILDLHDALGEKRSTYLEERETARATFAAEESRAGRPTPAWGSLAETSLLHYFKADEPFEGSLNQFLRSGPWSWPRKPEAVE